MGNSQRIATPEDMAYFHSLVEPETRSANQVAASLSKKEWYNLLAAACGWLSSSSAAADQIIAHKHLLLDLVQQVFRHDMGCRWTLIETIDRMLACRNGAIEQQKAAAEDYFETYTGAFFYPLQPDHRLIFVADTAHALSNLCMYGGHTGWFYSVAQHSVLVSRSCPDHLRLEGLLNYAAAAYLGNLPRWLGGLPALEAYNDVFENTRAAVRQAYGLATPPWPEVEAAEYLLTATERRDLLCFTSPERKHQEKNGCPVLPEKIVPLDAIEAEQLFLDEYDAIQEERETQEIKPVEG